MAADRVMFESGLLMKSGERISIEYVQKVKASVLWAKAIFGGQQDGIFRQLIKRRSGVEFQLYREN